MFVFLPSFRRSKCKATEQHGFTVAWFGGCETPPHEYMSAHRCAWARARGAAEDDGLLLAFHLGLSERRREMAGCADV